MRIAESKRTTLRAMAAAVALTLAALGAEAMAAPVVLAYTDSQNPQSYTNLQAYYASLTAVGIGSSYALLSNGTVDTSGVTTTTNNIIGFAKAKGLPLYPTVSDYSNSLPGFDKTISNAILASASSRSTAIGNLVNLVTANGFAGLDIDLEAVEPAMKTQMSSFIGDLATALHNNGKKLIISIPPKASDSDPSYLGGYDYAAIGAAVDYFQLMTYDEVGPGWSSSPSATWPGPELGLDWLKSKLSYAVSRVPASKVLSGLPAYGYDYSNVGSPQVFWKASNGVTGYANVLAAHAVTKKRDTASATPYATWGTVTQQNDGTDFNQSTAQPALWYDDAQSITAKTQVVGTYGLAGTSVWAMGMEDGTFWSAVTAGLPATGGGTTDSNVAPSGTGYTWKANAAATANTNKAAAAAVNDNSTSATLIINATGEGGAQKWEAAGVTFAAAKTVSSATFTNGAIDANGNGYFEGGLSLQVTTNGTTWTESGWSVTPAYPNTASAGGVAYTFTGTAIAGVTGVRVSGRTGASSWSGAIKELAVQGH